MARIHGKNAQLSYNAVTLQDELAQINLNAEVPEGDITAFADAWQVFLAGKKSISTDVQGFLDNLAGAGDITIFEAIGAGPKTLIFDLTGSGPAAGNPEYTTTASGLTGAYVRSYRISLPVGGPASYSASFQHSGLTSRAVA